MASKNDFSDRERTLMAFAWQCFEGDPKVDYKKLASLAGFTNVASASNAWSKIKKKIQAQAEEGGASNGMDAASGEEGTPKPTPSKKRAKGKADKDDDESPTKKAKGGKGGKGAKGKAGKKATSEEVEDGPSPIKPEPEDEDADLS
ncbi:hypothetical protein LTR08_000343 [Meristemomyces frigidus]|nr:hypothetical protein LTR08_000343 [Meristemomyces frigidus]